MKNYILVLILLLFGCPLKPDSPEVIIENKEALGDQGFEVGTLPNGKVVRRYKISMGTGHPHYLYVIDGVETLTLNHKVQKGKYTNQHTEAFADFNSSPSKE